VQLGAGETVHIRIAGSIDPETEEALSSSFDFFVGGGLASGKPDQETPKPVQPAQNTPPPAPPETAITKSTFNQQTRLAKFRFSSTVEGSSFQCKLDKGAFKPCASPKAYRHLKPGRHAFRVRAVAPSGLTDGSAAVGRFAIAAPKRRH